MSDAVIFRVFKLPESLLTAMREKRDEVETTNVCFLADAVDSHLPRLIEELRRLGFGVHGGDQQVARLPLSDESATLSLLREAAETVGLPATKLVELCLVAAVQPREPQSDDADGGQSRTKPPGRIRDAPDDNVKRTRPEMNDRHASVAVRMPGVNHCCINLTALSYRICPIG